MDRYQKIQFYTSVVLKVMIGVLVLASAINQNIFLVFTSLMALFLSLTPLIVTRNFNIKLPIEVDFTLTAILCLHYALGEYNHFYIKFWWWDLFLHGGNSIILGVVGFIWAYAFLITSRITAKPILISVFSLSFSVLIGVLWEIFEFGMDYFFGFTMQKSGLIDTMTDLMMDVGGAMIVSLLGFVYMKREKHGMFNKVIRRFVKNKQYEETN